MIKCLLALVTICFARLLRNQGITNREKDLCLFATFVALYMVMHVAGEDVLPKHGIGRPESQGARAFEEIGRMYLAVIVAEKIID